MKAIETKQILGIFMVIILVVIIVIFIILPAFAWGKESGGAVTFRRVCIYWSLNKPAFSGTKAIDQETGIEYRLEDPNEPWACPKNIGVTSMSNDEDASDWEECRNACRLASGG